MITVRSTVVVTDWEDHGSTMKEKYAAFCNLLSHGWSDHVSTTITLNFYDPLVHGYTV